MMHIHAKIKNVSYNPTLCAPLKTFSEKDFLSGEAFTRGSFLLDFRGNELAMSWWTSSKRTRTYPYARVYDTMLKNRRVTIIPFVKDEGKDGDRDFIQWDSVSLMSLLGVYVIIGYYTRAIKNNRPDQRHKQKITDQEFDYRYLHKKLLELQSYKLDALHWNLSQLAVIDEVAIRARESYIKIAKSTGVQLKSLAGIDKRIALIQKRTEEFKNFSRGLAESAQNREYHTIQPKEILIEKKAKISICNYLGGEYRFTIDEIMLQGEKLFLLEKKNCKTSSIPGLLDIKDAFLRMILFTNLCEVKVGKREYQPLPVLGMTSEVYSGFKVNSESNIEDKRLNSIFEEGRQNNFLVFLMDSKKPDLQKKILGAYSRIHF